MVNAFEKLLYSRQDGKLPIAMIGAVFLIQFMLTGLSGFLLNSVDTTRTETTYDNISDIEPLVKYSQIDDWEEYNPNLNVTGYYPTLREDLEETTNVYIPLTDVPNKYVRSPTVLGYEKREEPHNMLYNSLTEAGHNVFRYSPTNNPHRVDVRSTIGLVDNYAYGMQKYSNGSWVDQYGDVSNYAWSHFDVDSSNPLAPRIVSWQGWAKEPSLSPESDDDYNEEQPDNFTQYPLYLGGYGYGNMGVWPQLNELHCKVVLRTPQGSLIMNDSAHYLQLYLIENTGWVDGEIIGTSDPKGQTETYQMYGLYNSYHESHREAHIFDQWETFTFEYYYTLRDSPDGVWIYSIGDGLFYPAVKSEHDNTWMKKPDSQGCRYLCMYKTNYDSSADDNWDFPGVEQMPVPTYQNETYSDGSPILTSYVPKTIQATYSDYLDWIVINDTITKEEDPYHKHKGGPPYDGVVNWGNGEVVGSVTFWGQRGMKIMGITDKSVYDYDFNQLYWKIPDNYVMYDYWVCTIDLIHGTATCRGVVESKPSNTLTYTLSPHEYPMECNEPNTMTPFTGAWPKYFAKSPYQTDLSVYVSMTFTYLNENETTLTSPQTDLHTYVLSTTVAVNPKGVLWGDPRLYLQFYLPDEFSYSEMESYPGYIKMDNEVRMYVTGVVKTGSTMVINDVAYEVDKDGNIVIEYGDGTSKAYPIKGMSILWLNNDVSNTPTTVHLRFVGAPGVDVLVHDDNNPNGYARQDLVDVTVGEATYKTPVGTTVTATDNWYFSGSVQDVVTHEYQSRGIDVTSGIFQMNIQQAILIFLGISVIGLAGVMYYTNRDLSISGYVVIGGIVLLLLSLI